MPEKITLIVLIGQGVFSSVHRAAYASNKVVVKVVWDREMDAFLREVNSFTPTSCGFKAPTTERSLILLCATTHPT